MHYIGLYRLNPGVRTETFPSISGKATEIFRTAQTTCGYGSKESALQAFQINGGKITFDLKEFTDDFEQTDYINLKELPEVEIRGYWFDKNTKTLFLGVRIIKNDSPKLYELPLARVSRDNTETFLKKKGSNGWEVNYSNEKYLLKIVIDPKKNTYIEFDV